MNQEVRLILLVLVTGAFGSCLYALQSLSNYIGDRKLTESWFAYYLVRPPYGAGIAFVFYMVMRGGLLVAGNGDATQLNPYGLSAIAALAGMYSDRASLKLLEIFDTIFKAADPRKDKLAFGISTTALPAAKAGTPYSFVLSPSGGTSPYKWQAVTPLPAGLSLDPAKGEISGTPAASVPVAKYKFQVTDSTGATATADLELTVA